MPTGVYKRTDYHKGLLKGRTYENIYGIDRANEQKLKLRNAKLGKPGNKPIIPVGNRVCKCGCNRIFKCKINSKQMFLHGHNNKNRPLSNHHMRNVLKACCARPNKFETRAMAYLEYLYPERFIYTGDGTCIINHRSADAIDPKTRTVALFNGIYWHLKKYGFENTEQAKGAIELIEAIPFLESGYKVIFIWEDELTKLTQKLNTKIGE